MCTSILAYLQSFAIYVDMIYVYVYSYVIVLAACCLHKESSLQKWKTGIKEQGFTS